MMRRTRSCKQDRTEVNHPPESYKLICCEYVLVASILLVLRILGFLMLDVIFWTDIHLRGPAARANQHDISWKQLLLHVLHMPNPGMTDMTMHMLQSKVMS